MARRAEQDRLPGVESKYPTLDRLGYDYAASRDSRIKLLREEIVLKEKIMAEMRRLGTKTYRYQDLEMRIVPGDEKLKVKVLKDEEATEQ
jgi:hypothetical protein